MARNRIIYGSQSVWCNGEVLLRVQTLGSTTTFTNEDVFELGHLDIVDVVDDVPAVAVTINTNDWGDVKTMGVLAQLHPDKLLMNATATNTVTGASAAALTVVSGTTEIDWLHGVSLADFGVTCGNLTGVTLWAPVQDECDLGDYLQDDIDQTLIMDEVYVNSIEFSYTTGANATENYGAETDVKAWWLNDAAYVNYDEFTFDGGDYTGAFEVLTIQAGAGGPFTIPSLSDGNLAFVRKDVNGEPAVTHYDSDQETATNWPVQAGGSQVAGYFRYNSADNRLYIPSDLTWAAGDRIEAIYGADGYGTGAEDHYFRALADLNEPTRIDIGAIRQGQVEIYIVDPNGAASSYDNAWRLTAATVTADLTREALAELGHLGPYDRPLTFPIPITVTIDSTAGDLENFAKFAGKTFDSNLDDISLKDYINEEDLILVIKIFAQTDEEAGGTGSGRTVSSDSILVGKQGFNDGDLQTAYSATNQEYALKTIVVDHLKATDEAYTLDLGANATQTFGFRSTNDLFVIKGDISFNYVKNFTLRRHA
jgi:hypothetical protein